MHYYDIFKRPLTDGVNQNDVNTTNNDWYSKWICGLNVQETTIQMTLNYVYSVSTGYNTASTTDWG